MPTELEQMTAAGGTIVLAGQTYLLGQLTLGDYGQIQAWLRGRLPKPFAVVAEALKDLEPIRQSDPESYAEARKQLLLAAMEDARRPDGSGAPPELVNEALNGPEGVSMILWLCLRKNHPAVGYEQVRGWLDQEDLTSVKKKLDQITLFADDDEAEEGNPFSGTNPPTPPGTKTA